MTCLLVRMCALVPCLCALRNVLTQDPRLALGPDPRIDKTFSGTTAVCCLIIGNKLTVANVGDSRIILASRQGDKDVAEEVSIDHKPERPDEKARIHAAGGRVFAEIFEDDDMDGPARVWLADMDIPGLAMSRSMGDAIAKQGAYANASASGVVWCG